MTLEELTNKKVEAENKIVEILNEFEKECKLKIHSIAIEQTVEEFGQGAQVISRNVDILIKL